MIPKNIYITINKTLNVDKVFDYADQEYLQREGFREDWIKNKIEEIVRNEIWTFVNDNDIKIEVE